MVLIQNLAHDLRHGLYSKSKAIFDPSYVGMGSPLILLFMKYVTGNLLESKAQALVNTVNTMGVMGKGIALQFKEQFPLNFKYYAAACKKGELTVGKMLVVKDNSLQGEKWIINFPTKTEWYKKSQYEYVEEGLKDLVRVIRAYEIKSIAIPPLGCGNGGLNWGKVKLLMEKYLQHLEGVEVEVYEPNEAIKTVLQQEAVPKQVALTPGRAMLLYALYYYEKHGEQASTFAANKLAYFLQRSGESLRLKFVPHFYGPYDQAIDKVLYALNGKYLTGLEQMRIKPFEPIKLNWERYQEVETYINTQLNPVQQQRLQNLFKVIEGFESTLSLEVLASVDYLLHENPALTEPELLQKIESWSNRKKRLIKAEHIQVARRHLEDFGSKIYIG